MEPINMTGRREAVAIRIDDPGLRWYDVHDAPFTLHNFSNAEKGDLFRRLPKEVAEATNPGVAVRALNTAGGRVRFATDSDMVAIHAEISMYTPLDLMLATAMYGFDLYVEEDGKDCYVDVFRPGLTPEGGYESKLALPGTGMRQVTIHFPLYNQVDALYIGLQEGTSMQAHRPYTCEVPVVYYGSSITQGGCATHPGNTYEAMISRRLDCEYVNLGFAGSALAEEAITAYLCGREMSVFVCDYDHNAPTPEYLRETHSKLYHAVRAAQPELPIILVSRPPSRVADNAARRAVVRETYEQALAEGDRHVMHIDGATLFDGLQPDDCVVDGLHPSDFGFYRMAKVVGAAVEEMLDKGGYPHEKN